MERMYKANQNAKRLFAISRRTGMNPFYHAEVKDCVGHPMKLNPLEMSGWLESKKSPGEKRKHYRIKREAYWRVTELFAAEIAELEKKEAEQEKNRVLMPVPQDARVTRMIQDIWQKGPEDGSEKVVGW